MELVPQTAASADLSSPPAAVPTGRRRTLLLLLALAAAYVLLFVPVNLTGAQDPQMLAAFVLDEYSQFPVVLQMTNQESSLSGRLHNMVFYDYYNYGYPFFLSSALAFIPVRALHKLGCEVNMTRTGMMVLRELSPFFMTLALLLLVNLWTGFKSLGRSVLLFLFLASIPAVIENDTWWHPDSLAILFAVLTIFGLTGDNFRFGKWFYAAALFCGLAAGTKVIGLFFVGSVAVYLLWPLFTRRYTFGFLAKQGVLFVLLMAFGILLANPLLLVPSEAAKIIETHEFQSGVIIKGWGSATEPVRGPLVWYHGCVQEYFGGWWLFALVLAVSLYSIVVDPAMRLLNVIVLTWSVPFALYVMFRISGTQPRYLLPSLLPLLSCLANPALWDYRRFTGAKKAWALGLAGACLLLGGFELAVYSVHNYTSYRETLTREETNPYIAFYRTFAREYVTQLPQKSSPWIVLCDSYIYVPESPTLEPRRTSFWTMDYRDIDRKQPDIILLERANLDLFSNPGIIDVSYDVDKARRSYEFFRDAKQNALRGFHKVLETEIAVAFAKDT